MYIADDSVERVVGVNGSFPKQKGFDLQSVFKCIDARVKLGKEILVVSAPFLYATASETPFLVADGHCSFANIFDLVGVFGIDGFKADSFKLVFNVLDQFPGQISDAERKFAQQTVANMGNTTEANVIILNRLLGRMEGMIEEQKQLKSFKGNPEDFVFEPPDRNRPLTKEELEEYNRLKAQVDG